MATLTKPTQGGDSGTWGTELNTFLEGSGSVHLSETALSLQSTGQTTIYTVPSGHRLVIDKVVFKIGTLSTPPSSAILTIGEQGSATDFLGAQTLSNLTASNDIATMMPLPNATPVKNKSYAAAAIIEVDVTTADVDGGTDHIVYLYGTLFDV